MLFRKMLRDMKLHKAQFISIFLMSFLGVFIYTGISGEWYGLQTTVNHYYDNCNLANAWIYGNNFDLTAVTAVEHIDGVTGVQRRLSLTATADLANKPELSLHFVEENNISKCHLIDGQAFDNIKDGIWLDDSFAKAQGLKAGDRISISARGIILSKPILGTILSPEYVYGIGSNDVVPNHANFGFAYLPAMAFPSAASISYPELLITYAHKTDEEMEKAIDQALNGHYNVYINRNNLQSYQIFDQEIKQHKSMANVFPVAFLAIALLTILTTMTRMVNNQRTQIGTLKAIGFQRRSIVLHYISFGFFLSFLGSVLGSLIGPFTIPRLFYTSLKTAYTLPQWKPAISPAFYGMAMITTLACTLITYLTCRIQLKDTPSQTLRPKAPKTMKRSKLEHTRLWSNLSFLIQWNLRDIFRSKVRSVMAIIGVLGCSALLACALGMQDSFKDVISWEYSDINQFTTKITMDENASPEQIASIQSAFHGEILMEDAIELKANNKKKTGELLVTDHVTLIKATSPARKFIQLPENGIALSYKMAQLLGVKKGDQISWHRFSDESWVDTTVDEIYRSPVSQGIILTRQTFESLGYHFSPTAIVTNEKLETLPPVASAIWSIEDLTESYKTMTEAMNTLVYIMILAAALLAIVVLYNLGILSFTEMQRELATLKVMGFQTGKLRKLLATQTVWLSIIGIILGIPSGIGLLRFMMSTMGDNFDMMCIVSLRSILLSSGLTFALSLCVNLFFSGRLKKIDMVSSLKGVE